jgi:hypothetical protein
MSDVIIWSSSTLGAESVHESQAGQWAVSPESPSESLERDVAPLCLAQNKQRGVTPLSAARRTTNAQCPMPNLKTNTLKCGAVSPNRKNSRLPDWLREASTGRDWQGLRDKSISAELRFVFVAGGGNRNELGLQKCKL